MRQTDRTFFDGKRPWSRIKDRVLGTYLPPYLHKTQRLQQPIVIIDCFAGRGKFDDGAPGSPLIICQQIQRHAPTRATAYFVNKRPEHDEALTRTLKGFIDTGIAHPILGQGQDVLTDLTATFGNETVFVYLDPFGIKGCNFAATKRLLQRAGSTEILTTLSMPVLHRLAAHNAAAAPERAIVSRFHGILDAVFGDTAWRDIMFDRHRTPAQKETAVITAYCEQLRRYTQYAGACPVRDRDDSRVKYYIVFASRHPHALLLMNDIMLNAYQDHTYTQATQDLPLLAPILDDWRATRTDEQRALSRIITETVRHTGRINRAALWQRIVTDHFMQYREAEFREAIQALVNEGTITWERDRPMQRLNNDAILCPTPKRAPTTARPPKPARRTS